MSQFVIAYHGGRGTPDPEEGAANRQRWGAWLQGLGEAVVNPGTPLGKSKVVSHEGVSDSDGHWTGFTVVEAADMDAALAMAKDCPFLDIGTLEVAPIMKMG